AAAKPPVPAAMAESRPAAVPADGHSTATQVRPAPAAATAPTKPAAAMAKTVDSRPAASTNTTQKRATNNAARERRTTAPGGHGCEAAGPRGDGGTTAGRSGHARSIGSASPASGGDGETTQKPATVATKTIQREASRRRGENNAEASSAGSGGEDG